MPIFKVTVEVVAKHITYVIAADEASALQVPNQPDWYSIDDAEPITRATLAEPVESIHAVPKVWRDSFPWGQAPDEKTIRQWLRKKA